MTRTDAEKVKVGDRLIYYSGKTFRVEQIQRDGKRFIFNKEYDHRKCRRES